jgi:hypothetical protein
MSYDAMMHVGITEALKQQEEVKKRRKKLLVILLCLILSIVMVFGVMLAFFSDIFIGEETVTAGTLDIVKGNVTVRQNGTLVDSIGNLNEALENFNPGDVATISIGVKNIGSKSAWIRGSFLLSGTAMPVDPNNLDDLPFYIFDGVKDRDEAAAAILADEYVEILHEANPSPVYKLSDMTPGVINGNNALADYESETASLLPGVTIYEDGTNGNEGTLTYTIYFDPAAKNDWQGKTLKLDYTVEAIQYRNNPTKDWSDLTKTVHGIN